MSHLSRFLEMWGIAIAALVIAPWIIIGLGVLDLSYGTKAVGALLLFFGATIYFLPPAFVFSEDHFKNYAITLGPSDATGVLHVVLFYLCVSFVAAIILALATYKDSSAPVDRN